jgi:hypothetical protein
MRAISTLGAAALVAALTTASPTQTSQSREPSYAQCECKPLERDRAEYYSTIKNASLCVSTGADNHTPRCSITIYCLSEGIGPRCRDHPGQRNGIAFQATIGAIPLDAFVDFAVSLFEDHQRREGPRIDLSSAVVRDALTKNAGRLVTCFKMFFDRLAAVEGDRARDRVVCASRPASGSLAIVTYEADRWFALEFSSPR